MSWPTLSPDGRTTLTWAGSTPPAIQPSSIAEPILPQPTIQSGPGRSGSAIYSSSLRWGAGVQLFLQERRRGRFVSREGAKDANARRVWLLGAAGGGVLDR